MLSIDAQNTLRTLPSLITLAVLSFHFSPLHRFRIVPVSMSVANEPTQEVATGNSVPCRLKGDYHKPYYLPFDHDFALSRQGIGPF